MIPSVDVLTTELVQVVHPTRTYKINFDYNRISEYTDDVQALIQTIYLILSTERYAFPIYSWDYGIELLDLFGKPMPYVIAEIPRRVEDALTVDDRIDSVVDFEFEKNGSKLHTTFTVVSRLGEIETELEVEI